MAEAPALETDTTPPTEPKADAHAERIVPEKYEFKAEAGKTLDAKFLDTATPVFKELGLDNAQGQKLVDVYNKLSRGNEDSAIEAVNQMRQTWRGETEAALGVRGEALAEKLAPIGAMKDEVFRNDAQGRVAFEKAFDHTGAGDHPAIIQGFLKLAQGYAEGKSVRGGGPSPEGQSAPGAKSKPSAAQALWPNLPSSSAAA